jgi:hypothetical protein
VAKHKLDLRPEPEAIVIGISSHVNDYRLCWSLNKSLGLALARRKEDVPAIDGSPGTFPAYDHVFEEDGSIVSLLCNRSEGAFLLKEHREADFFLVLEEHGPLRPETTLERLRNAEFVLAAFTLDLKRLRSGLELFA